MKNIRYLLAIAIVPLLLTGCGNNPGDNSQEDIIEDNIRTVIFDSEHNMFPLTRGKGTCVDDKGNNIDYYCTYITPELVCYSQDTKTLYVTGKMTSTQSVGDYNITIYAPGIKDITVEGKFSYDPTFYCYSRISYYFYENGKTTAVESYEGFSCTAISDKITSATVYAQAGEMQSMDIYKITFHYVENK